MATPRRHTLEEAIEAINNVIAALEERVASDHADGKSKSDYEPGVRHCRDYMKYMKGLTPGRVHSFGWGMFDRWKGEMMPWDEALLKTTHDAQRIVRIYLQHPPPE